MILLIDNYDSFVFNLARYLEELGQATSVVRNDSLTLAEIEQLAPAAIVLSPGPCTPAEAGITEDVIRRFSGQIPLLGVCLGHQALASALGGQVIRAPRPVHGKTAAIHHQGHALFAGLSQPFTATRYHSLIVERETLPAELEIIAETADRIPMALAHRTHSTFGVQFHPESILTIGGHQLLSNFLRLAGIEISEVPPGEAAEPLPPSYWQQLIPRAEYPPVDDDWY